MRVETIGLVCAALLAPAAAGLAAPQQMAKTPAPQHAPAVKREGIEALEAQLDRALDRVSLPRLAGFVGRAQGARGYRLPGYGVVVVLTPRALPGADGGVRVFMAPRSRVRVEHPRAHAEGDVLITAPDPEELEKLERQVFILSTETERVRREAEENMERIVHEVRVRRAPEAESAGAPMPAEPPDVLETPEAPRAPEPPPAPGAAGAPAPAPPSPPGPPWAYWFGTQAPHDERTPERVIADVRAALVEALASPAGRIPGLGPDEFVTIAVDFEPGNLFAAQARPERTLVVRARVRDLDARAKNAIAPEELRKRLEVIEY